MMLNYFDPTAFTVTVDTGSTDLWVIPYDRKIELTNTTDIFTSMTYGSGTANGTIQFAEVKVDSFTLPSQGS